ncbi:MAG: cyclase family protein [Cognaticolwellia sp.]
MKVTVTLAEQRYNINTDFGYTLAIAVDFHHSENQPNHFSATPALASPMQVNGFIGDTEQGGSCNVNELTLNPHCNGTHTETIAHICDASNALAISISALELPPLMPCPLISITPIAAINSNDNYSPSFTAHDMVINRAQLEQQLASYHDLQLQCLVVRTLPNSRDKCQASYNDSNQPAFFTRDAVLYLNERGVEHLIIDLPSLDRLNDDGLLTCHHLFWQVIEGAHQVSPNSLINKTITEMAYIDNTIVDGFYFINLQTPAFINDAAPSRPMLYQAEQ